MAAGLACVLAFRPRRRGTPQRQAPVIQTQIILAVVGAVVMLVVGTSLARAFGIVGAAGLVRYRAKIDDPKDAGVMLSTLAIGLASGVGLWMLALFATAFILGAAVDRRVVRADRRQQLFTLKVKAEGSGGAQAEARGAARRGTVSSSSCAARRRKKSAYEVRLPLDRQDRPPVERDPASSIRRTRPGSNGRRRRRRSEIADRMIDVEASLAVVAELQRDAEVVLAQGAHRVLQVVLRRRA